MDSARTVKADDGGIYRPLMATTLTKEDKLKAKLELNEKPQEVSAHITRMREMLSREKDLVARLDEEFILKFLRARKFNDERAANLIKDYYRYRMKNPVLFRRPKDMESILRCNVFNLLAHRDAEGRAIFVMKIGLWCTESFTFKEFVGAGNILCQWALRNPVSQINGFVGVWDFKDYSFQHFSNSATPRLMWMLLSLMQDCLPGRFKVAYCVNTPPLSDVVWRLFKPILREKFRKRVVVCSPISRLHKYIHPSVLPVEYGGELPPSDCTEAVNKLLLTDNEWPKEMSYGFRSQKIRCSNEEDDRDVVRNKHESCVA